MSQANPLASPYRSAHRFRYGRRMVRLQGCVRGRLYESGQGEWQGEVSWHLLSGA